jgi:hypothetical protein
MDKDFIPYDVALELKELDFNELCYAFYPGAKSPIVFNYAKDFCGEYGLSQSNHITDWTLAPMYQQVLRWFRERFGLFGFVEFKPHLKKWTYHVCNLSLDQKRYDDQFVIDLFVADPPVDEFGEAEKKCVKALISYVKEKKLI